MPPVPPDAAARGFSPDTAWRLDDRVSVRPEPFGALLYHFGTRRLTFLKSPVLLDVVRGLATAPSARDACRAAGVTDADAPRIDTALAALAAAAMIVPADPTPAAGPPTPTETGDP